MARHIRKWKERTAGRRQDTTCMRRTSREAQAGQAWQAPCSFLKLGAPRGKTAIPPGHPVGPTSFDTFWSRVRGLRGLILSYLFCWSILKNCITQLDRLGRLRWSAPISDKTEVELRRFEIALLGSDFQRRMQSHSRLDRLGRSLDIAHMIFEAGGLICKTAPINTVRAELSLFWAFGAAGFCYGFHGSARSDGRVRNLRDAQLPRTIRQEPCRAGLPPHSANHDGIMFARTATWSSDRLFRS